MADFGMRSMLVYRVAFMRADLRDATAWRAPVIGWLVARLRKWRASASRRAKASTRCRRGRGRETWERSAWGPGNCGVRILDCGLRSEGGVVRSVKNPGAGGGCRAVTKRATPDGCLGKTPSRDVAAATLQRSAKEQGASEGRRRRRGPPDGRVEVVGLG